VGDGREALRLARTLDPDLIVMDIMLPGMDGMDITRRLRAEANIPVLMLTARDDEIDRVLGLEIGADDYMTKPFSMREFLARVKAVLRRVELTREELGVEQIPAKDILTFNDLIIDDSRHEVSLAGQVIPLKPKEYDLLMFLARHQGQVLSRDLILERVWGWDFSGGTRTVDVHIRWLRAKLEKDDSNPTRIVTVRGTGYRFEG
jgi:DNA-binding response OmpR family regulator